MNPNARTTMPTAQAVRESAAGPSAPWTLRAGPPRIAAFDLSLARTGWARAGWLGSDFAPSIESEKQEASAAAWQVGTIPTGTRRGMARLQYIRRKVVALARGADLVVLEGYSFGSGDAAHRSGELGGVVRLAIFEMGIPYAEVPPKTLKKFLTGRGDARKEEMVAAARAHLGYAGMSNDEADALGLLAAAREHYGCSVAELPASQVAALAKVEWPGVGR